MTGISAAAPLARRSEAGPGTANAARRSEAKPEFPQRKIPPAGEMSVKRTKGGEDGKRRDQRKPAAFSGHRKVERCHGAYPASAVTEGVEGLAYGPPRRSATTGQTAIAP